MSGAPILAHGETVGASDADEFFDAKDAETVATIKELIETRVRPAVANDGGDITFRGFKDGVVYLAMKGACSGCPSSTATLRHGIQNLLRHFLPDVGSRSDRSDGAKACAFLPSTLHSKPARSRSSTPSVAMSSRANRGPWRAGTPEALVPLIARVMDKAGIAFVELDRIAVTTGPGQLHRTAGRHFGSARYRACGEQAGARPLDARRLCGTPYRRRR